MYIYMFVLFFIYIYNFILFNLLNGHILYIYICICTLDGRGMGACVLHVGSEMEMIRTKNDVRWNGSKLSKLVELLTWDKWFDGKC